MILFVLHFTGPFRKGDRRTAVHTEANLADARAFAAGCIANAPGTIKEVRFYDAATYRTTISLGSFPDPVEVCAVPVQPSLI